MIPRDIFKKIRQIKLRTNRLVTLLWDSSAFLSLAPGFSPVSGVAERFNRFSGFLPAQKPLKRLARLARFTPG